MKHKKFLDDWIEAWGEESQMVVAIEEMSELQKELCKYLRRTENVGDYSPEQIAEVVEAIKEETADVLLTVEQIANIFGVEEIEKHKEAKIARTNQRLERYKNNK